MHGVIVGLISGAVVHPSDAAVVVAKKVSALTGLTESFRLQFRAESFNFQNRANFNNPNGTANNVHFGRITAAGDPRVLQFGLKLSF